MHLIGKIYEELGRGGERKSVEPGIFNVKVRSPKPSQKFLKKRETGVLIIATGNEEKLLHNRGNRGELGAVRRVST